MKKVLCSLLLGVATLWAVGPYRGSVLTAGYGSLYNYAQDSTQEISGRLLRLDYLYHWQGLLLEADIQLLDEEQGSVPFALGAAGYQVLDRSWFPDLWLNGSFLYLDALPREGLQRNLRLRDAGAGFMCGFRTAWLPESFGNFSLQYYPVSKVFYKSMQIGWNVVPHLGVSFGGLGVRVPQGRYYSSFVFALRTTF